MKTILYILLKSTAFLLILLPLLVPMSYGVTTKYEDCTMSFGDLRWQHRILLISIDDNKELKELTAYADYRASEFAERKLIVVGVNGQTVHLLNSSLQCHPSLGDSQSRLNTNKAVLIGLDGSTKQRYDVIDPMRIFSDIDAMPMRRKERNTY